MSRQDVPQFVRRNSAPDFTRRVSTVGEALVWGLGLVPMSWDDDRKGSTDAFTRIVPKLFPALAVEGNVLADAPEAPQAPVVSGTTSSLNPRQFTRRIIDDTLARLGKKGTFAVSGGRLTVYCPAPKHTGQAAEDLAHCLEPQRKSDQVVAERAGESSVAENR